jgi:hypothetical protein
MGRIARVESQTQQPLLAPRGADPIGNVQEGRVGQHTPFYDPDAPRLFDEEQPPTAVAGVGDAHRRIQACYDEIKLYPQRRRVARRGPKNGRWGG